MDINNYLMTSAERRDDDSFPVVKRIKCADGFSLSVQASHGAYCNPRQNIGPWYEVEVDFPSKSPHGILNYAEDIGNPTDTVYGYVPVDLVEELIESHGGQEKA